MSDPPPRSRVPAPTVLNALWYQAEGRRLAQDLRRHSIQALLLGGPEMQQRVFGDPAAFPMAVLELLVHRQDVRRLRDLFAQLGYRPHPLGGSMRAPSGRAVFERSGHVVDLRWRSSLGVLPAAAWSGLRRALWIGASAELNGFAHPRPEPLLVYLAGRTGTDPRGSEAMVAHARAVARSVSDWKEVEQLAAGIRLKGHVQSTLKGSAPPTIVRFDGLPDEVNKAIAWLHRMAFLPKAIRDGLTEYGSYRRQGLRVFRPRRRWTSVGGLRLAWWEGICGPGTWSEDLVTTWVTSVAGTPRPVMVEVGAGTGALAIAAITRRHDAQMFATDVSFRAARNARANVARHRVTARICRGDMLSPLPRTLIGRVDAVLAHLPSMWLGAYEEESDADVWAPRETYEGPGADGLDLIRRLLATAPPWLSPNGHLIVSMKDWQWDVLEPEAREQGYELVDAHRPSPTGLIVSLTRGAGPGGP